MKLQPETRDLLINLYSGPAACSVAAESMALGVAHDEPLLIALDAMLRYAKAYRRAWNGPVGEDDILGPAFALAVFGLRQLLNGDGAVSMELGVELGRTTDSKDNGTLETLYWLVCSVAGIEGDR